MTCAWIWRSGVARTGSATCDFAGRALAGLAFRTGEIQLSEDVAVDPRARGWRDYFQGAGARGADRRRADDQGCPRRQPGSRSFTSAVVGVVAAFAGQAAIAWSSPSSDAVRNARAPWKTTTGSRGTYTIWSSSACSQPACSWWVRHGSSTIPKRPVEWHALWISWTGRSRTSGRPYSPFRPKRARRGTAGCALGACCR